MASITYDGRSFQIDSRRLWIVAGTIDYARVPEQQWADRIHAAKLSGLNTIVTTVFWNRHEPMPTSFEFSGQNDLRRFVELIGEAGLRCVLKLGPFVGSGWDLGGLPTWLPTAKQSGKNPVDMAMRTANAAFLEYSSRFITKVAEQVRDLQVTAAGNGGPILLVQTETGWTCGDDDVAQGYLRELDRFVHEAGITVPVINDNNLWQDVEGQVDAWRGDDELLAVMRQLGSVRPNLPRLAIEVPTRATPVFGANNAPADPARLQRALGETLAGGGQFNLAPFHGGLNPGFMGGRLPEAGGIYAAATADGGAPLDDAGAAGPSLGHVRRIATFASSFERVFAGLEPSYQPVVLDPATLSNGKKAKDNRTFSVAHVRGNSGGVAFVFGPDGETGGQADLLLPDGSSIPVDLGGQNIGWCLFDVHLAGRSHLDYATLNVFTVLTKGTDSVLVCFGAAGSTGVVSINGSPLEAEVPKGTEPLIVAHEGATVVVCSEELIDRTFVTKDAVYCGVAGINGEGEPVPAPGVKKFTVVFPGIEDFPADGPKIESRTEPSAPAGRVSKKAITGWQVAPADAHVTGSSPRFAAINGPQDLTSLGVPFGYGWYRLRMKSGSTKKHRVLFPHAADRLALYLDGELIGDIGAGPGAAGWEENLSFKKGDHDLVVLADNMGRYSAGELLGEPKGLYGHMWEAKPFKLDRPTLEIDNPIDVLDKVSPVYDLRRGDSTAPDRIKWEITHRRKSPIALSLAGSPCRGLLLLNDEPLAFIGQSSAPWVMLDDELLGRGKNTLQFAMLLDGVSDQDEVEKIAKTIADTAVFLECSTCLTESADWAFAKWEAPPPSAFKDPAKVEVQRGRPAWFRARFATPSGDSPVRFDPAGLSKGQVYLNGNDLGRYFVADRKGKAISNPGPMVLPRPWLRDGSDNELVVFEESGLSPEGAKLLVDTSSVPLTL
ncbi:MAG: beta-galactosidase [Planctomycetota bacterium]